jgi:histidyl-tRNA synthetase
MLLDEDARRRLHSNPLRILDSKNPTMQEMIGGAPKLMDHLGAESMAHFEGVQQVLRDAGLPFEINPRLVRGLDYYNLTVFEWVTDRLGAQGTVCAPADAMMASSNSSAGSQRLLAVSRWGLSGW